MILQKIQRTGAIAGLCAAMAMTVPTVASATQLPDAATTWTGGPKLAAPMETAAMALPEGTIEVAQTPAQLQRRNRELRQNNRKLRNRNQTQRRAAYNAGRRHGYPPRVYHNNRWYYRRGDRYYDNTGAILATGVIAGAAGLIAGSAIAAMPHVTSFHHGFCRKSSPIIWKRRFNPLAFSPSLELSSQRHTTPEATNETAIGKR